MNSAGWTLRRYLAALVFGAFILAGLVVLLITLILDAADMGGLAGVIVGIR